MINANAEIGVAVANFFPTIGLSALYGNAGSKIGNVFKNGASVWNIAANVSGPLFQGGRLIESYRAQQAFWDETIAQYRETIVERSEEHTSELQSRLHLVCRLLLEKKKNRNKLTNLDLQIGIRVCASHH